MWTNKALYFAHTTKGYLKFNYFIAGYDKKPKSSCPSCVSYILYELNSFPDQLKLHMCVVIKPLRQRTNVYFSTIGKPS